ncbi:hypothetical protein HYW35_00240 [Candidatus Saccharibacteria bacterium]|nr:hypothetical protein [Candidatus Saccharibacteria bacterium]
MSQMETNAGGIRPDTSLEERRRELAEEIIAANLQLLGGMRQTIMPIDHTALDQEASRLAQEFIEANSKP